MQLSLRIRICGSVGLVHNRSVTSLVWRQLQAALDEGAKESYEETENRGKTSAENLSGKPKSRLKRLTR
jgi:hypothetical protein